MRSSLESPDENLADPSGSLLDTEASRWGSHDTVPEKPRHKCHASAATAAELRHSAATEPLKDGIQTAATAARRCWRGGSFCVKRGAEATLADAKEIGSNRSDA